MSQETPPPQKSTSAEQTQKKNELIVQENHNSEPKNSKAYQLLSQKFPNFNLHFIYSFLQIISHFTNIKIPREAQRSKSFCIQWCEEHLPIVEKFLKIDILPFQIFSDLEKHQTSKSIKEPSGESEYHQYSNSEKYILYDLFSRFGQTNQYIQSQDSPTQTTIFGAISYIMHIFFPENTYSYNSIKSQFSSWKKKGNDILNCTQQMFQNLTSLQIKDQPSDSQRSSNDPESQIHNDNELSILKKEKEQLQQNLIQSEIEKGQLRNSLTQLESEFQNYLTQLGSEYQKLTVDLNKCLLENQQLNEIKSQIPAFVSDIQQTISNLEAENSKLKQDATNYRVQISELQQEKLLHETLPSVIAENLLSSPKSLFFAYHISQFVHNKPGNKNNQWNTSYLKEKIEKQFKMNCDDFSDYFYGLLSFIPEYWFHIIEQIFNLPSLSTCIRKRESLIQKLQLSPAIVSTAPAETLKNYIEQYWGQISNMKDRRCVLAIDAAALSVNGGFNPQKGTTIGFIEEKKETFENLQDCLSKHSDIAKSVFVIQLCHLDHAFNPIIINREYTLNGRAHEEQLNKLDIYKQMLESIGLTIVGCASDGDPTFFNISKDFSNQICSKYEEVMKRPLHQLMELINSKKWFQDVLHVLKCDRYTLVSGKRIRLLPGYPYLTITQEAFIEALQGLPSTVFSKSSATKMDDGLVFRLFDWKYVQQAMINNHNLIPILLPPALLLQIFYNPNLTRDERYYYLNLGAAIVYIYALSVKYQKPKLSENEIYPFNEQDIHKYMLLSGTLALLFTDERSFDLADCTSHLLEHFFGLIRRFCCGNNSKERFEQSLKKAFCLQTWTLHLMLENKIPGRKYQDSAAVVEKGLLKEELSLIKFGSFVREIYQLFCEIFQENFQNFDFAFPNLGACLNKYPTLDKPININFILNLNFNSDKRDIDTLKQDGSITSRGLINIRQVTEASQADHIGLIQNSQI